MTNPSVCSGEFLWKSLTPQQNFVGATYHKKSNQTELVQLVAARKFICRDKDFHKILQDSRSNLSLWCVAATSCPACTHRVIHRHELLLQLVTYSVFLPLRQRANVNMYHVTRFSFYWLLFIIYVQKYLLQKSVVSHEFHLKEWY